MIDITAPHKKHKTTFLWKAVKTVFSTFLFLNRQKTSFQTLANYLAFTTWFTCLSTGVLTRSCTSVLTTIATSITACSTTSALTCRIAGCIASCRAPILTTHRCLLRRLHDTRSTCQYYSPKNGQCCFCCVSEEIPAWLEFFVFVFLFHNLFFMDCPAELPEWGWILLTL